MAAEVAQAYFKQPGSAQQVTDDQEALAAEVEETPGEAARGEPSAPQTGVQASKRKRSAPSLEAMAGRIKFLQKEADEAEAAATELEAALLAAAAELEAKLAAKREDVELKRAAVSRASQEYVSKQCEAALAQLEADIPKRPPKPYIMFQSETKLEDNVGDKRGTKVAMWANLPAEEKRKFFDRYAAGMAKFKKWADTEEGCKNLRERNELLRKCRATSKEELEQAIEVADHSQWRDAASSPPLKRAKAAKVVTETPTKHRGPGRPRAQGPPLSSGQALDAEAVEEASKADLLAQLRNLAGRPDVAALGKSSQELLRVLQAHSGMVNAAKHALLSA